MHTKFLALICSVTITVSALAQEADTTGTYVLERIVVTAERSQSMLARSIGATSVVSGQELRQRPGVTGFNDILRQIPGFAMLSIDGQGFDPQAVVRGFYGGGETEYVLVLLDGRPMNNMEMGLINWSQIPLSGIRSVEVIRGGASSLYGDAAVGGVLNVVTDRREVGVRKAQLALSSGSFGTYHADGSAHVSVGGKPLSAFAGMRKTAGFRAHSARRTGSFGVSLGVLEGEGFEVMVSGRGHRRWYDIPGPLTQAELGQSRVQESPFYRFDNVDESTLHFSADVHYAPFSSAELSGAVSAEWRSADLVRTLPLAAAFADTKGRAVRTERFGGTPAAGEKGSDLSERQAGSRL